MDPFSRYLPALEAEMHRALETPPRSPDLLYGMLRYHLGWVDAEFHPTHARAGKRLRPIFLLLTCEAQAGAWRQALPAAAAVELLHNFSLIHDDIEDRDATRRGRSTLWNLWGEAQAINAGDALFAIAYRTLEGLRATGVPPDRVLDAQEQYLKTCVALTEGQYRDLAFETMESVTLEPYLQMVADKTAALLGLACELGGLIAGAPEARVTALKEFGVNLGLAFQMQDDLLGLWGDPERTGKPVGADLRQRKKTLPILHGLANSSEFRTLVSHPTLDDADVAEAQILLEAAGSREYTEERAAAYHRRAMEAFERTESQGEAAEALKDLAQRLLNRDK